MSACSSPRRRTPWKHKPEIVGLYVDPPAHTVVLPIDEKSQIQALDRTQSGLPLKPGRCGTIDAVCGRPLPRKGFSAVF